MLSSSGRFAMFARCAVIALAAGAMASPAAAQLGGLRKKIKPPVKQEAATAPAKDGGTVVLTGEVVDQLLTGLKAGQAERDAAAKEDTPFGRYKRATAAYEVAKPKCEAAQPAFYQRAAQNEKMLEKYNALTEKMVAAQSAGDMKRQAIYQDSAMALIDPSCAVRKPEEPNDDVYEAERAVEARAEAKESEASGFSRSDMALLKERAIALLSSSTPPGGASTGEKSAVAAKSAELKPLLGIREAPPVQAAKPAPAPAAAPASGQTSPEMSARAASMNDCMMKNLEKHQGEIEALGKRAEAAQNAGDNGTLMAIVDTLQRLQMGGCQ